MQYLETAPALRNVVYHKEMMISFVLCAKDKDGGGLPLLLLSHHLYHSIPSPILPSPACHPSVVSQASLMAEDTSPLPPVHTGHPRTTAGPPK